MGKLAQSTFQSTATALRRMTVRTVTLDTLIDRGEVPPPDVVKIDVEGAEALVLKGFLGALQKYKPILFIEIHSRELARECKDVLERLDYRVVVLETMCPPDFQHEPVVCHFIAKYSVDARGISG